LLGKKLLVVEDDPDLQRVLVDVLELEGAMPVACGTAACALEELDAQLFDLLVLDLNLPDMSGWEVLRRVQAGSFSMPAVVLTASASEANRQRAMGAGAADYVVKPVAVGPLIATLQRHLADRGEADS
jgi:DNA-binding response OmpR family regulator